MDWTDEAIVLSTRRHGETSAIATILTREHGRHVGLVRGGAGRVGRAVLQPGNRVHARWWARLEDQLGTLNCELARAEAAGLLVDARRLTCLAAACAVAAMALPEREPCPAVYHGFTGLLDSLAGTDDGTAGAYVRWEMALLAELGYGLDLDHCAVTGRNNDLAYVSPRTGRAVCASAGEPYRDKLLRLPRFLLTGETPMPQEVVAGLTMTGYFLTRHVLTIMPSARIRLAEILAGGA
ncbi:MAG: DNA repair protein RecO [Alphaproteobacteria bacterium]|nr:DNA repair protein RecO [Alphaproteobacteria bacterium]